jgi:hypothetical protein
MPFSHSLTYSFSNNGAQPTQFSSSQSFDGEVSLNVTVPAVSTDFVIVCPVDSSLLESVVLWSDVACTVVSKDSGDATLDTWVLTANKPLIWQDGFPTASPVSGVIATLEVTCTPETVLQAYFGMNV